jgi:hypothetical protein
MLNLQTIYSSKDRPDKSLIFGLYGHHWALSVNSDPLQIATARHHFPRPDEFVRVTIGNYFQSI